MNRAHPCSRMAPFVLRAFLCCLFLSGLAPCALGQIPCRYDVIATIQAPPCPITGPPSTVGIGISPNGRYVCGYYSQCNDGDKAYVYDTFNSHMTTLPFPPGINDAIARDVNNSGMTVGAMSGSAGYFGFVFDLNTGQYLAMIADLAPFGSTTPSVNAINSSGVACGTRTISNPPIRTSGFTWSASTGVVDLGLYFGSSTSCAGINESGMLTGTTVAHSINTPFVWFQGRFTLLAAPTNMPTTSLGINSQGVITGSTVISTPPTIDHAFMCAGGAFIDLPSLSGFQRAVGLDISDGGFVVGFNRVQATQEDRGVLWRNGQVNDLNTMIDLRTGLFIHSANAIDPKGVIVASARYSTGHSFVALLAPTFSPIGDINYNCVVNVDDLLLLINNWGLAGSPGDINNDGTVNVDDLLLLIQNWTVW